MKKEKSEELFVKWIDGLLEPEEETLLEALLEKTPELEAEMQQGRVLVAAVRAEVSGSVEPPYGDFFNSQLMRKIDLEIDSHSPARKAERWWQSLQWAWAPAGALALVLAFFAGHRLGKPGEESRGPVLAQSNSIELPSVYFTSDALNAEFISNDQGEVSAIVVNGLEDLKDDLDISTASTQLKSGELPVSYLRSKAQQFH